MSRLDATLYHVSTGPGFACFTRIIPSVQYKRTTHITYTVESITLHLTFYLTPS